MTKTQIFLIAAAIIVVLGVIVFPLINRRQLKNMPYDQQIRVLMKQAKGLIYWKNISYGTKGVLVYIKNKRKIYGYPWVLVDGKMICTKKMLYDKWDYPEEQPEFTDQEKAQAKEELEKYNQKSPVKLHIVQ